MGSLGVPICVSGWVDFGTVPKQGHLNLLLSHRVERPLVWKTLNHAKLYLSHINLTV
jgi:hypothetical protein